MSTLDLILILAVIAANGALIYIGDRVLKSEHKLFERDPFDTDQGK